MAQYKGAASEAGRAMQLMKKREKEREQLEQLKQKIAEVCNFYPKLSHLISHVFDKTSFYAAIAQQLSEGVLALLSTAHFQKIIVM